MKTNERLIFITGSTGFIGSHIVEELILRGYRIRCLIRSKGSLQRLLSSIRAITSDDKCKCIEFVYGDITKEIPKYYFRDVDIVLHLAAKIETGYYQNYNELFYNNVIGTKNVAEASLASESIENFIYFSSIAAIGIRNIDTLFTEDIECRPDTPYGKAKYEAELMLKKFWNENGLPLTILRLPTVYGPGEHYNFRKLVKVIKDRRFAFIGHGENLTNVLYVKNLSHEINKLFKVKGRGEIYHLADAEPISWKKLVEYISRALGISPPNLHVPISLARGSAIMFEIFARVLHIEPPLHRNRVKTLTSNFAFSIEKAAKQIGYSPPYPTKIGIEKTIQSLIDEI